MYNYKHITEAVDKPSCDYLTDFLKQCKEDGVAVQDDQCPDSWSVGHNPVLDKLLEDFLPKAEYETGKKLFPTYAYARYYKKGEVLECHTDRPSCEYSATITLGFNDKVWPLHIADPGQETDLGIKGQYGEVFRIKNPTQINMKVGDAVIYKGCDAPHWREPLLESDWQTQVFLHYVDQDGPHAEWKFDKRPCLAHHEATQETLQPDPAEVLYWYVDNAIADISCEQMIIKFESSSPNKAQVGGHSVGKVDLAIRDVNKLDITPEIGIGATLTGMGLNINDRAWKFDITRSNQTEYLMYDQDGHYKSHVDTFCCPGDKETRKITVLAFLNDDFEGGKFYLENGHARIYPPQKKGTVLAFPSFINHGVEPVTKGIRRSIVTWLVGPWFK